MVHYISYIKDSIGNNYLGLKIDLSIVDAYLEKLKEITGDSYNLLTNNQKNRDHGSYHITVINVVEFNNLTNNLGLNNFVNSLENTLKIKITDLKLKGIGSAIDKIKNNITYFIVCESKTIDNILYNYNLPKKDLHITIGFDKKDVFDSSKSEVKWFL